MGQYSSLVLHRMAQEYTPPNTYERARKSWKSEHGEIILRDVKGKLIAALPVAFLNQGLCNTPSYILEVVRDCVEQQDGVLYTPQGVAVTEDERVQHGGDDEAGQEVQPAPPLQAGLYVYMRQDAPDEGCTYARGPESKRRGRPATDYASDNESPGSAPSSQVLNFFDGLVARDRRCLVTEVDYEECDPVHLVPVSRPDVYAAIRGEPEDLVNLYDMSSGIFVARKLRYPYENYQWSLWPDGNRFIVHYFLPGRDGAGKALHGKVIEGSACSYFGRGEPDKDLVRWHYKQCVQARFRGFSAKMTAEDARAEIRLAAEFLAAARILSGAEEEQDDHALASGSGSSDKSGGSSGSSGDGSGNAAGSSANP